MSELKFDAEEISAIYSTNNFKQFKLKLGNRSVNKSHVKKLVKEISKKDLKIPIEIDNEGFIIDGQHRFFAYQELNKSFRFFISPSKVEVEDIQNQNNIKMSWTMYDYMESYINLNNDHYIALKSFIERHNLGLNESLLIFEQGTRPFKTGGFKVNDIDKADELAEKVNKIIKNWERTSVDRGVKMGIISFLKSNVNIDVSKLIQRMIQYPSKYYSCTRIDEYNDMLYDLYNYNTTKKHRIQKK